MRQVVRLPENGISAFGYGVASQDHACVQASDDVGRLLSRKPRDQIPRGLTVSNAAFGFLRRKDHLE